MDVESLIHSIERGVSQDTHALKSFVQSVGEGKLPISEATRWLKAVHQHGISVEETVVLTEAMINSGARLTWEPGAPVVDKHSTGGVGDKMSLILAPALAECGCRVPMLAGRGLGHTGGTIDKLEAIPGFNCRLSPEAMQAAVDSIGCCIAVQNEAIAPADGVLYSIRDISGTIDSLPLITASIISKKAAEGLDALVLDVKCGSAAFMQTMEDAVALAQSMVNTAEGLGIRTAAQITSMDKPIGTHVGNALEVIECIQIMQGEGNDDTRELVVMQGAALLAMTMEGVDIQEGRNMMNTCLNNGTALQRFKSMCIQQGVEPELAEELIRSPTSVLPSAANQTTVLALDDGYLCDTNAMGMAIIARKHGAGRFTREDVIVPDVGFVLHAKTGDKVSKNMPLFTFHHHNDLDEEDLNSLQEITTIGSDSCEPVKRHLATVKIDSTKP